jgi:hypothetical protein
MVLTTKTMTEGIQIMFAGLTKDAETDFKYGKVLAVVLSHVSDFVANQPGMLLKLQNGLTGKLKSSKSDVA